MNMKEIFIFIIGIYIGTEIQAWWYRKGCSLFLEWKKNNFKNT